MIVQSMNYFLHISSIQELASAIVMGHVFKDVCNPLHSSPTGMGFIWVAYWYKSLWFLKCQLTCHFFLHVSQHLSNLKVCLSIDMLFFFWTSFRVSNTKNLQKLCQNYTLLPTPPNEHQPLFSRSLVAFIKSFKKSKNEINKIGVHLYCIRILAPIMFANKYRRKCKSLE